MKTVTLSVRVSPELAAKLEKFAKAQERSKSWLAANAIEDAVARMEEWDAAVQEGLDSAERGEFVELSEVIEGINKRLEERLESQADKARSA